MFSRTNEVMMYPGTNTPSCHLTCLVTPASNSARHNNSTSNPRQLLNINNASPCKVCKACWPNWGVAVTQFAATGQIPDLGHQTKWRLVLVTLRYVSILLICSINEALLGHRNMFWLWSWLLFNVYNLLKSSEQK